MKKAAYETPKRQKLISRKIWVAEKNLRFPYKCFSSFQRYCGYKRNDYRDFLQFSNAMVPF